MAFVRWWPISCVCVFVLISASTTFSSTYTGTNYYKYFHQVQHKEPYEFKFLESHHDSEAAAIHRRAAEPPQLPLVPEVPEFVGAPRFFPENATTISPAMSTNMSAIVGNSSHEVEGGGMEGPKTGGNYLTANSSATAGSNATGQDANRTSAGKGAAVTSTPVPSSFDVTTTVAPINITTTGSSTENSSVKATTENADVLISKFPEDITNSTFAVNNITKTEEDSHQYYNSSFIVNNEEVGHMYWVNMSNRDDVQVNEMLSKSHRRAATVKLSFDFPFYGHVVRNVTIATGGFLYTGDYVHSWLAATQYIAPLMANFDTSLSNDSYVKYVDNGTAFTVQWEKVVLQDRPESGDFTFQATLHRNGDIVFVYRNVPVVIENIRDDHHPVKVGLSDAYIIDRTIFFVRRKTIYEYHRVNFDRQDIKNWTVIYLYALPTCLEEKDCMSCTTRVRGFNCSWCPSAQRCSNGMDRFRQDWLLKGCDKMFVADAESCPAVTAVPEPVPGQEPQQASVVGPEPPHTQPASHQGDHSTSVGTPGILSILLVLGLVSGLAVWGFYAYRNPHTPSGQLLIRYRPSQWSWKRGEARYTAATIHM